MLPIEQHKIFLDFKIKTANIVFQFFSLRGDVKKSTFSKSTAVGEAKTLMIMMVHSGEKFNIQALKAN